MAKALAWDSILVAGFFASAYVPAPGHLHNEFYFLSSLTKLTFFTSILSHCLWVPNPAKLPSF